MCIRDRPRPVAKPKASGSGRGRPRRDLVAVGQKFLEEFAQALPGSALFSGKEAQAHKRWLDNLVRDLKADISQSMDEDVSERLALSKQLQVVVEINKSVRQDGVGSPAFAAVFREMENFMESAPSVDSPLPKWMAREVHQLSVAAANTPAELMSMVLAEKLLSHGYSQAEVEGAQASLMAEYIVVHQRGPSAATDIMDLVRDKDRKHVLS
eukprot:6358352-Alexandrium_andersonii.AAC.1